MATKQDSESTDVKEELSKQVSLASDLLAEQRWARGGEVRESMLACASLVAIVCMRKASLTTLRLWLAGFVRDSRQRQSEPLRWSWHTQRRFRYMSFTYKAVSRRLSRRKKESS